MPVVLIPGILKFVNDEPSPENVDAVTPAIPVILVELSPTIFPFAFISPFAFILPVNVDTPVTLR